MLVVEIGLKAAKESYRDANDAVQFRPVEGARVLEVHIPDGTSTAEAFRTITDSGGVVVYHSDESPVWVHCAEKPGLTSLLAEHYECSVGKPDDVEETHWTLNGPPGVSASSPEPESAPEPAPAGGEA
jgi:hypothetical protein